MAIRILLADDHKIMREGLINMISTAEGMEVVGQANSGREAVELARNLRPDVVVMDVSMPDLNGIDAARRIKKESQDTRIVALSMHSDKRFVSGMIRAGASAYLLKECAFEELIWAIRAVVKDQIYLTPGAATLMIEELLVKAPEKRTGSGSSLTPREREVLQLIAEGQSTKEISEKLGVSSKTIDSHRHRIMEKVHAGSVAELTKFAIKEGLTIV
ncbi:MAG: response regulator transcription factor [Deltaproteobacteria bacterium]|nr:response regulator transcription factor [Deltaproteobacteria bacterium]